MGKNHTKKIYFILIIIVVSIIFCWGSIRVIKGKNVYINNWNDLEAEYRLCTVKGRVDDLDFSECTISFKTHMSLDEIIETNREDYVGKKDIYFYSFKYEAALFFRNDNYYFIYYNKDNDNYRAGNLCARWTADGLWGANIKFPFPEAQDIYEDYEDLEKEFDIDIMDEIFEKDDFETMKEFYSRLSPEICSIDEENQIITVKAYSNTESISWDSGYLYEIVIDCKNHTITGPTREGGTVTLE